MITLLKLLTANKRLSLVLALGLLLSYATYAVYQLGITHEATRNKQILARLESQLREKEAKANEDTKQILVQNTKKLEDSRLRLGPARPDLTDVRVLDTCPSSPEPAREAPRAPERAPEVSQEEWERINEARFEENRIQLESLIQFIDTLYRTWSPR